MPQHTASMVSAARAELEKRRDSVSLVTAAREELARRKQQEEIANKVLNLDLETGLPDLSMRIKMSFAETPEKALQTVQKKYPDTERLPDGRMIYFNNQTKKFTTVDEESLSLGDLADMAGFLPEMTFATIGSIAGGGTPASIAGAGAGMAIGQGVKRTIGKLFFNNNEMLGRNAAKDMTISGITGALGEGAGTAILKTVRPFAKKVLPETRKGIAQFAKFRGKLSPAQATETRVLDMMENIGEYSLIGAEPFRRFRVNQELAIDKWATTIAKSFGDVATPEQIGILVKQGIKKKEEIFKRAAGVLYRKVDDLIEGGIVPTKKMKIFAEEQFEKSLRSHTPSLKSKTGENILNDFKSLPDKISFSEAQAIRSDLAAVSRQTTDVIPNQVIGITKKLTTLTDEAIRTSTVPKKAINAFDAANTFWKTGKKTFNHKLVKALINDNPEKVGQAIFRPGAITDIKMVKKLVGKTKWTDLQNGYLQTLLKANPTTGIIEGKVVLKKLTNMGDDTLKEIFGPVHTQEIKNFATIAQRIQSGTSEAPGKMLIQLMQGSAAIALVSMDFKKEAAMVILGPAVLARLFTNSIGIRWLTTGLTLPAGTKEATKLGAKILALTGKEKYE